MSAAAFSALFAAMETRNAMRTEEGFFDAVPVLLEQYRELARSIFLAYHLFAARDVPLELYFRAVIVRTECADPQDWPDRSLCLKTVRNVITLLMTRLSSPSPLAETRLYCSLAARLVHLILDRFRLEVLQFRGALEPCPAAPTFSSAKN